MQRKSLQSILHTVNHILEVVERKLWSGEKVFIPAGSAKLVKVRIEGDWRGKGFVESMLPEEQESGLKLVNIICQALHKLYTWRTMLRRI